MPWSPGDASRFKKDIAEGSKDKWAAVANNVLQQTGDEGKAIRTANGVTRAALHRKIKRG